MDKINIQEKIEERKESVKQSGALMSAEIALTIERETVLEKLEELEARITALEK